MMHNMKVNEVKVPKFGEQLFAVDIDNNNGDNTDVYKVKVIFAELAEMIKQNYEAERSPVKSLLFDHAIGELVSAQMAVVKVLTFKPWQPTEEEQ
jgi:hypothetical protein